MAHRADGTTTTLPCTRPASASAWIAGSSLSGDVDVEVVVVDEVHEPREHVRVRVDGLLDGLRGDGAFQLERQQRQTVDEHRE